MAHPLTTTELFLVAMAIIFLLPWALWRLARLERVAPLVVVQIVTGVLLGPGVLGQAFPGYYQTVFTPAVIGALNGIAWWGVMLFVMLAGIELDLRQAWAQRRDTVVTAALALGAPLLLGAAVAAAMLAWPGWLGPHGARWQFVAGVGMACAVTALPILILLMEQLGILRSALGQRILRYASLDDLAIWGVLALILMDWQRIGRQAAFLLAFALASLAFRRLLRALPARDRWYALLVWLLACGWGADWSGLHYMVGAFLAGVVVDHDWFDQAARDRLRQNVLLLLMPVFFLSTGLRTGWEMGGLGVLLAAAALLAAAVAGKLAGTALAARLLGWPRGDGLLVGWLLQTKALIMIIFANVLLDKGIIASATFTALLLMAVASTVLTVPMAAPRLAHRGAQ